MTAVLADRTQLPHFEVVETGRFIWKTENAVAAAHDRRLLRHLGAMPEGPVLEIGCGEGINLAHIGRRGGFRLPPVAADFAASRARYAAGQTGALGVCADATALPFPNGHFDLVFCRDLLHHIPQTLWPRVMREMVRVGAPAGRVVLIESSGRNPLIRLQAQLLPVERGQLDASAANFRRAARAAGLRVVAETAEAPLPLDLLLVHPRFGLPQLAGVPGFARAALLFEKLSRRLVSKDRWSYVVLELAG